MLCTVEFITEPSYSVEFYSFSSCNEICRELRDSSCMAYEHFNKEIVPILNSKRKALWSSRLETIVSGGITNYLNESTSDTGLNLSSGNIISEILHSGVIRSITTRINKLERMQAGTSMLLNICNCLSFLKSC